jgi:hypothetical protein
LKASTLITTKEGNRLVSLLYEYADVFTWTYKDISSLDTNIVVHKIPLVEGNKPVK